MFCMHFVNGKFCGGTVDKTLNVCYQCGGQACPNCSGSVVHQLIRCTYCGWELKQAISSRRYDTPSEREIHNRERTNQNLNASHTDTQLDSSIDPWEFSYLYESLTQYCQTPGLFPVGSYSHTGQVGYTPTLESFSNGRFDMSQVSSLRTRPSVGFAPLYGNRSTSFVDTTVDCSNSSITQSLSATGEGNEDTNASTGTDSSSSSEDEVDNKTNHNAANNTNNNVNPSDGNQETNPNLAHDSITGKKKKKKNQTGQNNQSSNSFLQAENNTTVKDQTGKENQKTTGQTNTNSNLKNKNKIQVYKECYFHVIVAPTILCVHNEDTLIIKVEGISQDKAEQKLNFKRALEDGFAEYEGSVSIPMRTYPHANLCYNYFVLVKGKDAIQEYVLNRGQKQSNNRRLSYKMLEKKETFHIFDSIVRGPMAKDKSILPDLIVKGIKKLQNLIGPSDYQKMLRAEVDIVMRTYLPDLPKECSGDVNGEEMISQIYYIFDGLKEYYVNLEQLWGSVGDFEKHISQKYLASYLSSAVKWIQQSRKESNTSQLTMGLIIVHLKDKYNVPMKTEEMSFLLSILLPKLDKNNKSCLDLEGLKTCFHSKEMYSSMSNRLLRQMKMMINGSTPNWLLCIPLLHYVKGLYHPYQAIPERVDHKGDKPMWWGSDSFDNELQKLKSQEWIRSPQEMLQIILPYFDLDFLFPRTFIASLNLDQFIKLDIQHFSPDILLGAVYYFINSQEDLANESWVYYHQAMLSKISSLICNLDCKRKDILEMTRRAYKIGADVLDQCLKTKVDPILQTKLCLSAAETYFCCIHVFENCLKEHNGKDSKFRADFKLYEDAIIERLVLAQHFTESTYKWLMIWNDGLKMNIPEGAVKDGFIKLAQTKLEYGLNCRTEIDKLKEVLDVYCDHLENFSGKLQEVLGKSAFHAIEKCASFLELDKLVDGIGENRLKHYGELLSYVFERSFDSKKVIDKESFLAHAVSWPSFAVFLKMYNNYPQALKVECLDQMDNFIVALNAVCKNLYDGTISIHNLKSVAFNIQNFGTVIKEMKGLPVEKDIILESVNLRHKQLHAYESDLHVVQHFVYVCKNCGGNTENLSPKVKNYEDLKIVELNQVCSEAKVLTTRDEANSVMYVKCSENEDLQLLDKYCPKVIAFGLNNHQMEMMQELEEYTSEGDSFTQLLDNKGQLLENDKGGKLSVDEVLKEVWEPTKRYWTDLCAELEEGELHFSEFKRHFQTDNIERLRQELKKLRGGNFINWIDQRIHQFEQYRDICYCSKGAEAILKVVQVYDLKGNFDQIKETLKLTGNADTKMKKLDESLLKTCSLLNDVNDEKAKCLIMFAECKNLILWLRESMHSIKELQVLVDLAMNSAGEGDMAVDRVHCLHSATTGYGPLIFNFDENCDDKAFLEKCKQVWRVLSADPKLPNKLHGTYKNLDWLKSVKKSHGSVEVNSLCQAEAINAGGVYVVGIPGVDTSMKKLLLTDVLDLSVNQETNENDTSDMQKRGLDILEKTKYNYGELQDLQSRLMLVAGKAEKGNDEVERFTMILDSVVRLGNIYTKLVSDGCVLFTSWNATFLCDKKRPVCVFINFGQGREMQTLKGNADDVAYIIPKIAEFLENCHKKWLSYINEKREQYYLLNYFSIDQIVILQQELVKLGLEQDPSVFIYPMLSAVKHDCTENDLMMALSMAKHDVVQKESSTDADLNKIEPETQDEDELDEDAEELYKEIIENDFPKELAREALKHCTDIEEALLWCDEHEADYKKVTEEKIMVQPGDQVPEDLPYSGWIHTSESRASMTANLVQQLTMDQEENAFKRLQTALQELWDKFLNSISSSVSDYLSIEHLCLILERLSRQETMTIERTMSPYLKLGEPNLIIVQESEMYNTVLSIYNHEDDKPLPQSDEVLLCTATTTLDVVEIFWRRCLFAENDKIYCLVNADILDYDVADKAERKLQSLMTSSRSNDTKYKLVILCCAENENKSVIVRALTKYQRPQLFAVNVQNVKEHLLKKLIIESPVNGSTSASSVDFERSSVRVVKSCRAGVGKSLYKKRMVSDLLQKQSRRSMRFQQHDLTIPLHDKFIDIDEIMAALLDVTLPPTELRPRIFHIDLSHEVQNGVDVFLFQLLVLGCLTNTSGYVWRKSAMDYYIVETLPLMVKDTHTKRGMMTCLHHCLEILPSVMCRSPQESLEIISGLGGPLDYTRHDRLFDSEEFRSTTFQRPYQYLKRLDTNCRLDDVKPNIPEGDKKHCLVTLLRHCGIRDPSWSEIHHFVSFLDAQLQDFEVSSFCSSVALQDLPGFPKFVLRFLIQMSRDFSTRSLVMSEESPTQVFQVMQENEGQVDRDGIIEQYQMRRTWESSPHPYLFFNPDHHSMTFLGFNIEKDTRNLIDLQTKEILEKNIMEKNLFEALSRNKVNLTENFDALPRHEKILKLCNVMGIDMAHDPDPTYELTTDNVKKILAIYMRFRCGIPVIIMGETGCGKTRLIKFMCSLQQPPGLEVQNMILMKVHGGTKASDIIKKVNQAEKLAAANAQEHRNMDTVLFFDEANSTEAIGVIKEIMCDKTLGGKQMELHQRLKMVAACNPYRKHSKELIQRLEQAGLGYHVDAEKTTDKLGHVPMRNLVYRVQPLPQSMLPLVWDFGQLDTEVEELYIRQMVLRYINNGQLPALPGLDTVVSKILTVSQEFMRKQKDECSFVSLRDVERVLQVMSWFFNQAQDEECVLFTELKEIKNRQRDLRELRDGIEYVDAEQDDDDITRDDVTRSLVLALGVCYHACLKKRKEYRRTVARHFKAPLSMPWGADQIEEEISHCQSVFIENVELPANIAKNKALKENVFMMIVCIELRIPLFLVGKPGSSKSLAKTIVADAMLGNAALNDLFRNFKKVKMVSFQCSPLSTPDGIVKIFRECAAYQEKNLEGFVSVVVLDEIGLAEDSPRMPLKTLHPLLEDGCCDDEEPEPYKKVGFIGISNWALDPAKMNRGILVQRDIPDKEELLSSARKICSSEKQVKKIIKPMIEPLAVSYTMLFDQASREMREFFGLRDFYSLLKMLYGFVLKSRSKPTWLQLKHCILRNFGGLPEEVIQPVDIFARNLAEVVTKNEKKTDLDPECSPTGMIKACLEGSGQADSESRYLLLLTENYGALTILQQKIFSMHSAEVIFGSSFPSDQEYTQVCRNINRIKVCMETGSTVILLNLENLYESLYDALNQYYFECWGERYVDLGLGTHRVKCRVHRKFRLVVVAEKQVVYDRFPIPLINRLEKHFLSMNTMLTMEQADLTEELTEWAENYAADKSPPHLGHKKEEKRIGDAFMGYHADTCAAIIHHICEKRKLTELAIEQERDQILKEGKSTLLWCATPAAVSQNGGDEMDIYSKQQQHESLKDYLYERMKIDPNQYLYKRMQDDNNRNIYAQITTNSRILSPAEVDDLLTTLPIDKQNVTSLTLQQFHTEQQFSRQIRSCAERKTESDSLLIVQCECGDQNAELIACARYSIQRELKNINEENSEVKFHVVLLVHLPGIAGDSFTGFQCGLWHSAHIDDLRISKVIPAFCYMHGKTAGEILSGKKKPEFKQPNTMDVNAELKTSVEDESESDLFDQDEFNIKEFILSCIHKALACLKDPPTDSARTTERLKIVLNLLENHEGPNAVLSGVAEHTTKIIIEREESHKTISSVNWLNMVASKSENIKRAGTFRKSVSQGLESRVVPILAGIVSFIDTNRNLDILIRNDEQKQTWQTDLWLHFINDPELTQLNYATIVSPKQQELQEVFVKTTSATGKVFSATMPFSWLIYNQIDEVLTNTKETQDNENNMNLVLKAADIFRDFPVGKLLLSIDGVSTHAILECYIRDFVHMVYPVQTEDEGILVCEGVAIGCRRLLRGEYGSLLPSLFGCHVAYFSQAARFKNFSHIVCVWPDCSEKIVAFKQKDANNCLVTDEENTLDILALQLLIDDLRPAREQLNRPETRNEWLQKVCQYRPVVERIFGHFKQDILNQEFKYEGRCQEGLNQARYKWTRTFIVKLFIENVCMSNEEEGKEVVRCMALWTKLGRTDADLKALPTFEAIETYLKQRNESVLSQCFGILQKCSACGENISSFPVKLPCNDVYCKKCFKDLISVNKQCMKCNEPLPENFNPEALHKSENLTKYRDFRRRCNSFFMEVVSQLCFADGTPPSPEAIKKLQSYIIGQSDNEREEKLVSKELTVFQDSIDPTPVVRSFLLQQLIQTSGVDIEEHLTTYFERTSQLVASFGKQEELVELCLLILQCMEDSIHQKHQQYRDTEEEITVTTRMIREASNTICSIDIGMLERIINIAKIKFSLSVVANYVQKICGISKRRIPITGHLKRLFETVGQLCEDCACPWPRKYFVKHLCRSFGIDTYQIVKDSFDFLEWIQLPDLKGKEVKECHDRYIVCGDKYKVIREAVVAAGISQNEIELQEALSVQHKDAWQTRVMVLLALHREVAMNNIHTDEQKFSDQGYSILMETVSKHALFQDKDKLPATVMRNELWKDPRFNIYCEMNLKQQNYNCLLTHYLVMMMEIPGEKILLSPLKNIALFPENMIDAYFPTMPQDEAVYAAEAILQARSRTEENPVLYQCPNGHPYIIGDCGRPNFKSTCNVCGDIIGGIRHKAFQGNEVYKGDTTATGHILGRAGERNQNQAVFQDRNLENSSLVLLRLFTHMSMFIGCNFKPEEVLMSIKVTPELQLPEVSDFLLEHIGFDLECLHRILGKSHDDIFLLIHHIIARIMEKHSMSVIGEAIPLERCQLTKNDARIKWEQEFAKRYITPILKKLDAKLKKCNDEILIDKRLGSDPLLQLLYETDIPSEMIDITQLQDIPAVWRYRARISVDHLTQMLNSSQQQCPVLSIFLEEESILRALRFIPSIQRLQKLLMVKYYRKIDKNEGTSLQIDVIEEHMEKERRLEEFRSLLCDYTEAWECVVQSLESYTCSVNGSYLRVKKEHLRKSIDGRTPVSFMLPTLRNDDGLCAYMLLRFLLEKQNNFLEKYCMECQKMYDSLPRVHVKDISSAHLISYHPDKDLLPMVLANCNYSFEVGHGTKVDYNFANLERQLMDRLLFSKSVITGIEQIDMFRYRTESTNALVFDELSQKVKQERINTTIQSQIHNELQTREYSDLCDSLVKLDIAISFLKSVGSDPDSLLSDFMCKTLKMENQFPSLKAQQFTKCKNTLSWWITLSLEREKQQANSRYNQNAFESLSDSFKDPLEPDQITAIEEIVNGLSIECIHILLVVTFECIVLRLDVPLTENLTEISLQEILIPYIESSPYEEDTFINESLKGAIEMLPFGDNNENRITTAQIVDFWKLINKLLISKQHYMR